MNINVCVVVGEASGDAQFAAVLPELRKALEQFGLDATFWGIAGSALRAEGVEALWHAEELSVMGFVEVLPKYAFLQKILDSCIREIEKRKPAALICVDFPGFNLALAQAAFIRGVTIIYHIPPKFWARSPRRAYLLRDYTHLITCILPFEVPHLRSLGANAYFVGNPLCDKVREFLSIHNLQRQNESNNFIIALLPGSRKGEIQRVFPVQLEAFSVLLQRFKHKNFKAFIPIASSLSAEWVKEFAQEFYVSKGLNSVFNHVEFIEGNDAAYRVLSLANYGWICSGTAVLEAAFFYLPMAALYRVPFLTALFFKCAMRVPWVTLPNLCLQREVVPEFLQYQATVSNLVEHACLFLESPQAREQQIQAFQELNAMFPLHSARCVAQRMAKTIFTNLLHPTFKFRRHTLLLEERLERLHQEDEVSL